MSTLFLSPMCACLLTRLQVDQRDGDLGAELFENIPKWIAEGKFKPNDVLQLNGLQSVPEGFQLYRDGKISAKKIVYKV